MNEEIEWLNESIKCTLAPSAIHGVGVVALRDIKKGERLYCRPNLEKQWFRVPFERFDELRPEVSKLILDRWPSVVNGSIFLSPNDMTWLVTFMNHSENPNYDPEIDTALKDIQEDEEVTEDYRTMKNFNTVYPWLRE